MIGIRSITVGTGMTPDCLATAEKRIANFLQIARRDCSTAGMDIRTERLVVTPLTDNKRYSLDSCRSITDWISELSNELGIRWFCVPLDYSSGWNYNEVSKTAVDIITNYPHAFLNLIVTSENKIDINGVKASAKVIKAVSRLSSNGFDNFRVGVSLGCKPNTPFFPFSYHNGNQGFSFALELVDLFIEVIESSRGLGIDVLREKLVSELSEGLRAVNALGLSLQEKTSFEFKGIDASLAPYPNGGTSVGRIIELLANDVFGSASSVFYTSLLTDVLKESFNISGAKSVGFNGVMYSLLEDDVLSLRNKQKFFSIDSLLLYSTVCGCGLDMVPVPGDVLLEELSSTILDVAGLAFALKKPLGVRILPVYGLDINDITNFNYDFLVDTRVMPIRNRGSEMALLDQKYFSFLREK